jgi:hypothetical protein
MVVNDVGYVQYESNFKNQLIASEINDYIAIHYQQGKSLFPRSFIVSHFFISCIAMTMTMTMMMMK